MSEESTLWKYCDLQTGDVYVCAVGVWGKEPGCVWEEIFDINIKSKAHRYVEKRENKMLNLFIYLSIQV